MTSLWHRRFAHFGATRIIEASGLVDGLEITSQESMGKCEDCMIGNQKRRAYDEKVSAETEVVRLTNIDLWGPVRVASAGGAALYAMKFHDNGILHRKPHCRDHLKRSESLQVTIREVNWKGYGLYPNRQRT